MINTPIPSHTKESALARRHRVRQRDQSRHRLFTVISTLGLFLTDLIALLLAFVLAYRLHDLTSLLGPEHQQSSESFLIFSVIGSASIIAIFIISGLYQRRRGVSRIDEMYRIVVQVSLGFVISLALSSFILADAFVYSRQTIFYAWLFAAASVTAGRYVNRGVVSALRSQGIATDRLLIVGAGTTGQIVLDKVRRSPQLGYDVVGFVRHRPWSNGNVVQEIDGCPVLGASEDLAEIVDRERIDEIIIALSGAVHEEVLDVVFHSTDQPVTIRVYPDTFRLVTSDVLNINDLNGLPTVRVRTIGLRPVERVIKRAMDLIISLTVLIALSPLMFTIAGLIKLTSRGPVFFAQERVGRDGRSFHLLKFRSMPVDAEKESGPVFARKNDPRPTRVGHLMRRYSIDELPQFINVFFGEMSIVGPRPERPYFVEQFRQIIPAYIVRLQEKAGITGWAQVNGMRGDTSIDERTRYDLYYVENWSILFDLKIMVKTIFHVFTRDNNAY